MTYQDYLKQCKDLGFKPTMTEKQFSEMLEIKADRNGR